MSFPRLLNLSYLAVIIMGSIVWATMTPPMTENLEWKGRVIIEISNRLGALNVEHQDGLALSGNDDFDVLAARFNVMNISKMLPHAQKPKESYLADLSRFYLVEFPYEVDLHEVIDAYAELGDVVMAEPYYIRRMEYIPNDTYFGSQWGHSKVGSAIAFDFARGSEDLIIGIVDSGTDTLHQDLKANLWINPGEDLNGNGMIEPIEWNNLDDDGNNFIDDFWGWNVWHGNNNVQDPPLSQGGGHGTHCAGDANAVTDNGIGVGALGFKAKIMTARAGDGAFVYAGYAGIDYCVNNGANVISLSWGNYSYSSFEQTQFNNAYDQGVLIFASAGNDNSSASHYPSAYDNVISVAASNQNDQKAGFSNFGSTIDICSPGVSIMSTVPGNTYQPWSGTSMAGPFAAGLALLLWSAKPEFTNEEVENQIFNTCVNIDNLNPGYAGQLGWGRIDAATALSSLFPILAVTEMEFDDSAGNGDSRPDPGETVDFLVTVQNSSTSIAAIGVDLTLECDDPDISMVTETVSLGNIAPGSTVNNYSDPLQFFVDPGAVAHEVTFSLTVHETANNISIVEEIVQMIGRPDVIIVADDGGIGYYSWYDQDLRDLGIQPDIWNVDRDGEIPEYELAYYPVTVWHTSTANNPISANEEALIESFLSSGGRLFLTGQNIDEQMAGTSFYADVLHAVSTGGLGSPQISGIEGNPITNGDTLITVGAGGAGNSNSPSTIEPNSGAILIYEYLPSGQGAGISWEDAQGKLVYLSFCFEAVSGGNFTATRTEILDEILNWFGVNPVIQSDFGSSNPDEYLLEQNYPNPFNPTTEISFSLPVATWIKLSVYDLTGRKVATILDDSLPAGNYVQTFNAASLTSGIYIYRIETGEFSAIRKMVLLK